MPYVYISPILESEVCLWAPIHHQNIPMPACRHPQDDHLNKFSQTIIY